VYGRVAMVGNYRINDLSAVQTAPAVERHLATDVHYVQKEVYDHTTLTTFTLHMVFSSRFQTNRLLPLFAPGRGPSRMNSPELLF